MTENEIISWIFLATALASQKNPAEINSISMIADGINHSVPTDKELKMSLSWLITEELISKQNKKYILTEKGKNKYLKASEKTNILLKIWDNLNKELLFDI
jgi:predicted transcriptional regulator